MKKVLFYLQLVIVLFTLTIFDVNGKTVNDTSIVINEIFYNPPNNSDDTLEFIELYNAGNTPINMTGFRLKSPSVGTTNINVTFPDITLLAGGYLVLAADSIVMKKYFGITSIQWNNNKKLNNTSKDIVLFDSNGDVIDSVTYFNSSPWPKISSAGGPSIELLSPDVDNTIGTNWEKSNQVRYLILGQDTLLTVYCSPGQPNINHRPIAQFSSDKRIISLGDVVTYSNESINYDSLLWTFVGGNISCSQEEQPQVTYNDYGMFDVSLLVSNENGEVILTKSDYIISYPECTPISQFPYNVDFTSLPDCWFTYPLSGDGAWALDDSIGHYDTYSIKFDCAGFSSDAVGTIYTNRFNLESCNDASISFYYCCPGNYSTASKAPVITINTYSSDFELVQSEIINATKMETWAFFTMNITQEEKYCSVSVMNRANNNAVYIDDFVIQDRLLSTSLITGNIMENDVPLEGILVKFQPGDHVAITDGTGHYSAYIENGWSGTVMPANPQYIFTPKYLEVIDLQGDISDMNFTAVQLPDGWIFSQTNNSHTFCVPYSAVDTSEIGINSWIGVFYEDSIGDKHCCGAGQMVSENTFCLNAWAANPETNDIGFTENTPIYWKVFDSSTEQQFDAEVEYASGPEVFTIDGITVLSSVSIEKITQTIIVPTGWTGISSYIVPYNPDLEILLEQCASDVIILMNDSGSYVPGVNSNVNQWNANKGWLIKTKNTVTLDFIGKFNPDLSVNFPIGWTIFPVKSNVPVSIDSLFGNTSKLDIIKGYGMNEIYIPGITQSYNLQPGKSYKAHFNSPYSINYNEYNGKNNKYVIHLDSIDDIIADENIVNYTPLDHIILIEDRNKLMMSDTVFVYSTEGLCCGFGAVNATGQVVFKVFGDDPTTEEIDGMIENELMIFKLKRNNKEYNLAYSFNINTINYDMFIIDGFTYINKIIMYPTGINNIENQIVYAYPNPVNNILYIYKDDEVRDILCRIIDIMGRVVYEGNIFDKVTDIDMTCFISGVYVLELLSSNCKKSQMIVKM